MGHCQAAYPGGLEAFEKAPLSEEIAGAFSCLQEDRETVELKGFPLDTQYQFLEIGFVKC